MRHITLAIAATLALYVTACNGDTAADVDQPEPAGSEEAPAAEDGPAVDGDDGVGAPGEAAPAPAPGPQDPWMGPADEVIGADVAFEPMVFEGDDVVIAVTGMTVYREGAQVRVSVREHPDGIDEAALDEDPLGIGPGPGAPAPDPDDPEVLELSFVYPDGETASSAEPPHGPTDMPAPGEQPDGPILLHSTSQSTPGAWDYELWLWPLPQQDDGLEVTASWPERDLDATAEIAGADLSAAAERVVELWAD